MSKRFYAVTRCVFNHLHFAGGKFYEEHELTRGLLPGEKWQEWEDCSGGQQKGQGIRRPGNKYMIQTSPKPKERPPYEQKLLENTIADTESRLMDLRKKQQNGNIKGVGAAIEQYENILRELRSA